MSRFQPRWLESVRHWYYASGVDKSIVTACMTVGGVDLILHGIPEDLQTITVDDGTGCDWDGELTADEEDDALELLTEAWADRESRRRDWSAA